MYELHLTTPTSACLASSPLSSALSSPSPDPLPRPLAPPIYSGVDGSQWTEEESELFDDLVMRYGIQPVD